jgi:hypothetical protein
MPGCGGRKYNKLMSKIFYYSSIFCAVNPRYNGITINVG